MMRALSYPLWPLARPRRASVRMNHPTSLLLGLFAGAFVTLAATPPATLRAEGPAAAQPAVQDPQPTPAPKPDAKPVPPPTASPTPSPDGKPAAAAASAPPAAARTPHPLEGVYSLRARLVEGKAERLPSRGFVAITQRHLFLCFASPGPTPEAPLLRAGVRTWKPADAFVDGVVQLGWYTDVDGKVVAERAGAAERRRIEAIPGGIRIYQDTRSWLDFERVE